MSVYYIDSSALVKRYCHETGSLWVRHLADPEQGNDIFTAHITGIEVIAAIARKARMREMAEPDATTAIRTFRHHFQTQYQIVLMTAELVDRAMELAEKRGLRGYDATQLASALVVHAELGASGVSELIFICADTNLNAVAQTENLSVENPNDHA
jgi:predicted nucleic acid-binding protein